MLDLIETHSMLPFSPWALHWPGSGPGSGHFVVATCLIDCCIGEVQHFNCPLLTGDVRYPVCNIILIGQGSRILCLECPRTHRISERQTSSHNTPIVIVATLRKYQLDAQ